MGVAHDGGYAEYVRVPGDWVVRRPESMTAFDAMTLGTAGYTAAQAIMLMEHNGLKPDNGPVAVTGATGGVGSVAVEILAKIGYHVVAITGKPEEARYLRALGAKEVLQRQAIELSKIRPLDKSTWAGAIDNLGGDMLAWLLSTSKISGTVAAIGLAAGMKLHDDGGAVHPARRRAPRSATAPIRRCRCARRSGTSSRSSGAPIASTTRCARSTSTSCRRTSIRTSRAWSGAGPSCGSRRTPIPGPRRGAAIAALDAAQVCRAG